MNDDDDEQPPFIARLLLKKEEWLGDLPWYYVVGAVVIALWVTRKLLKCIRRRSEQNSIGATKRRADGFDRWNPRPSSVVPSYASTALPPTIKRYAAQGEERPVLQWLASNRGRPDAATPFYREALRIRRDHLGSDHTAVANSLLLLGEALVLQGDDRRGLGLVAEAVHFDAGTVTLDAPGPHRAYIIDTQFDNATTGKVMLKVPGFGP